MSTRTRIKRKPPTETAIIHIFLFDKLSLDEVDFSDESGDLEGDTEGVEEGLEGLEEAEEESLVLNNGAHSSFVPSPSVEWNTISAHVDEPNALLFKAL